MDDLVIKKDYRAYKSALDAELKTNVESFVRIGYLLKVARDTDVLKDSGYHNVADFAKAEYGLTKDVVSRYIAINDRYSEGGYSDRLQLKFENYGVAKLSEMLTLPDSIVEEIEPTLTRAEIQNIKKEVIDEEKVTPMELYLESIDENNVKAEKEYTFSQRVWLEFFKANLDLYEKISIKIDFVPFNNNGELEQLYDFLAPSGSAALFSRIPGTGKIMITLKEFSLPITMTNVRSGEKIDCTVENAYFDIAEIQNELDALLKAKEYPEVAPVQQEEPKQEAHVEEPKEASEEIMPAPITEEAVEEHNEEAPTEEPVEEAKAEPEEETAAPEVEEEVVGEPAEPVEVPKEEPKEETTEEPKEEKAAVEEASEKVDILSLMFKIFDAAGCIKDTALANVNKDAYAMSDLDRIITKAQQIISCANAIKEA